MFFLVVYSGENASIGQELRDDNFSILLSLARGFPIWYIWKDDFQVPIIIAQSYVHHA